MREDRTERPQKWDDHVNEAMEDNLKDSWKKRPKRDERSKERAVDDDFIRAYDKVRVKEEFFDERSARKTESCSLCGMYL
mmetsp:Transcript_1818/g.2755  ORF Transcript_1818/g.2755 Transcript_1818/m.2755 type:complete len:80 (+) Transcript_1818:214-453(+)